MRQPPTLAGHPGQQLEGRLGREVGVLGDAAFVGQPGQMVFDHVDDRLIALRIELSMDRSHPGPAAAPVFPRCCRLFGLCFGQPVVALDSFGLSTNMASEHISRLRFSDLDQRRRVQLLPLIRGQLLGRLNDGLDLGTSHPTVADGGADPVHLADRPRPSCFPASGRAPDMMSITEQDAVGISDHGILGRLTIGGGTNPHQE